MGATPVHSCDYILEIIVNTSVHWSQLTAMGMAKQDSRAYAIHSSQAICTHHSEVWPSVL